MVATVLRILIRILYMYPGCSGLLLEVLKAVDKHTHWASLLQTLYIYI